MKAVVPVNVTALRVSGNDMTNVTPRFRGATVAFDALPYQSDSSAASTGDTIARSIDDTLNASHRLGAGVHLHWELPDYFRLGRQDAAGGPIRFPQVPNRWLVTRTSSAGTSPAGSAAIASRSWIVESDFVAASVPPDRDGTVRTPISVPITDPASGAPSMRMGRVVAAQDWNPASDDPASYLPHYSGPDGTPYYLTAVGFVGAAFSGYYPDCSSVFGFWDSLLDLADQLTGGVTLGYTVFGWIADPAADPLAPLGGLVRDAYNIYVGQCAKEKVPVTDTPLTFFHRTTADRYGWTFSDRAFTASTDGPGGTISGFSAPDSTVCCGVRQDVVWSGTGPFVDLLAPKADGTPSYVAQVRLAAGNTTAEAVAALVKQELATGQPQPADQGLLDNYELLLEALQLGVLRDLESATTTLATLAEQRHSRSFARQDGGHLWTIQAPTSDTLDQRPAEVTLPLDLAEQLHLLNRAQQAYDSARAVIEAARGQLFMDWTIFVKQWVADQRDPGDSGNHVVSTTALGDFLDAAETGELHEVQLLAASAGLAEYHSDEGPATTRVSTASAAGTLAADLVAAFGVVQGHLPAGTGWQLVLGPAPRRAMPTDPVLVMQGEHLEQVRRNGPSKIIAVRVDTELITQLEVTDPGGPTRAVLTAADLAAATAPAGLPAAVGSAVVSALLGEAALLSPQSAGLLATALAARGFTASAGDLIGAVQGGQGGRSPLDQSALPGGLFAAVRSTDSSASPFTGPQPVQQVQTPVPLRMVFANPASTALAPNAVGWSAQAAQPELGPGRVDPFLPLWMTWEVKLWPLARPADDTYPATLITDHFELDGNGIDLTYRVQAGAPTMPLTATTVSYHGTVVLSAKALASLTDQIGRFLTDFAQDPAEPELRQAQAAYDAWPVMAQSIGTFNLEQTLRTPIPMIAVMDLTGGRHDDVTPDVAAAAVGTPGDSWYATAFNALAPMPDGDVYFSPLRGGFLEVTRLEIIDVFGQVMGIATDEHGGLEATPSLALRPRDDDTTRAGTVYLPPRVLAPARVDANWLSAAHNDDVPGVTGDFVEMNSHPATSPVCGWIVPNHLDVALAFYDAGGAPIGSFTVQHDGLTYVTRAGREGHDLRNSAEQQLTADIGPAGAPVNVNPHVARLMWFLFGRDASFLAEFMAGIATSEGFTAPARATQDPGLAVLIGQPLAITRATIAMSTAGQVVPPSQLNTSTTTALATSVDQNWTTYADRQQHTSAGLQAVTFPARLGNLVDIDDGLVAFLPEAGDGSYSTVYMPAGYLPAGAAGGPPALQPAGPDTTLLQLNAAAQVFTLIADPRAPVHVSTGVLPAAKLAIPPDQYSDAMRSLAVTFATYPLLRPARGMAVTVPAVAGFDWAWVGPGAAAIPLTSANDAGRPVFGYTPQSLTEGWLQLTPQPPTHPGSDDG